MLKWLRLKVFRHHMAGVIREAQIEDSIKRHPANGRRKGRA